MLNTTIRRICRASPARFPGLHAHVLPRNRKWCGVRVQGLMAQLNQRSEAEEVGGNAWRELCGVRRVQWEKFLKTKLEDAVRLFNDDYRKGFQMMQARPAATPPELLYLNPGSSDIFHLTVPSRSSTKDFNGLHPQHIAPRPNKNITQNRGAVSSPVLQQSTQQPRHTICR